MLRHRPILLAAIALTAASLACGFLPNPPVPPARAVTSPPPTLAVQPATPQEFPTPIPPATVVVPSTIITSSEEQQLIELYQRVNPSVVSIIVLTRDSGGQGSGFVFDKEGHIVTNQHVVEGAESIEVDFASGLKVRGRVVGEDPDSDLAVIKVDAPAEELIPVTLADSEQIKVGQRAVAIGNPFGKSGTMTLGIISGLGRTLGSNRETPDGGNFTAPDVIQTDAPINPGNSGGPLLNMQGHVIGVNRAISSESGFGSGVGYAIAANTVRQVVPYLIEDGRFIYPYLGISSSNEVSLQIREALGLSKAEGTDISRVVPGGPADQAGLRGDSSTSLGQVNGDGDLIVGINGQPVHVFGDLMKYLINNTRPGQEVTLSILRGGQPLEVKVTLGARP
jgi:2-alkenal reductase